MIYVLDGGAFLYRVPWFKGQTYITIFENCYKYILQHFPNAIIVFDGYDFGPSTKDITHIRRSKKIGKEVDFSEHMQLTMTKEEFLSNLKNKSLFLKRLTEYLQERHLTCITAKGDADCLIVETAIERSTSGKTVLVGDDTDLLILLLHHAKPNGHNLFLCNQGKRGLSGKLWNIQAIQEHLGVQTCRHLLFVHAILGCDTTSRLHGIGKSVALKKVISNNTDFIQAANVFIGKSSSKKEIEDAGEKALLILYGGEKSASLNVHRWDTFQKKVASASKFVQPQDLPPTSEAAKYHIYRVFLQIQQWLGSKLDPTDWGWVLRDDKLYPITTNFPPAPQSILKGVKCSCTGTCFSARCSCRKNGIECSTACKNCKGHSCFNSSSYDVNLDDECNTEEYIS